MEADPWWWSQESSLSASSAHEDSLYDTKRPNQSLKVQPGEVIYKYGLSRELTMEPVQFLVEGFESRVPSTDQLSVTVQLVEGMGSRLSSTFVSTGPSILDSSNRARWSEHLVLPFKISDVPEDAALELTILGPPSSSHSHSPTVVGRAKFPLFSREGRLRTGKQEIEIHIPAPSAVSGILTMEEREEEHEQIWCRTTIEYELEESRRKEAQRSRIGWLNSLAEARLVQIRQARRGLLAEGVIGILAVEFFDYGVPIIYEPEDEEQHLFMMAQNAHSDEQSSRTSGGETTYPEIAPLLKNEVFRNVVEEKCYAMRRSITRKSGGEDPNLRPNVHDLAQIERILGSLSKPRSEDEDLLWKFRHSLVRNSKALTKVLASVKWDSEDEVVQASRLLDKWESAEVADVLTLLSGEPEFSHPVVRTYAVKVLSSSGNSVLLFYMPQLVQALRYDILSATNQENTELQKQAGPLQTFLINKCSENEELASCLHWLIKVECALAKSNAGPFTDTFASMSEAFKTALIRHPQVHRAIQVQDEFVSRIMGAARSAAVLSGRNYDKTKVLLVALDQIEGSGAFAEPIPLAGFPGKHIIRIKKDTARIMKSTTTPAVIDFVLQDPPNTSTDRPNAMDDSISSVRSGGSTAHHAALGITAREPPTIRVMFKVGDDLRQDQLIIQLIELMDSIFRENGLDLEMTIYRVLATAPVEGLVEFVSDAIPLTKVKNDYGTIMAFLSKDEHLFGGRKAVLERFIRSNAGYAVATYVLGIGDRHLDNILLRPNGHMFHIDFGFVFGRDPKSFAAPIRLSSEMMEAMGEEGEKSFRRHCWEALKALRGKAALILSVVTLMADASIPDLSKLQMPSSVLSGMEERLKLGLTDEEAERSLNSVIDQSISALGPVFIEYFHYLNQQLRA